MGTLSRATSGILITGGARGIGRATALLAADQGWEIAINNRDDAEAARDTAAEVERRGGRAILTPGDVAVEADVVGMVEAAMAAFGGRGGVVIDAGIVAPASPLADRLKRMFDVDVLGADLCAREAARRLPRDRRRHPVAARPRRLIHDGRHPRRVGRRLTDPHGNKRCDSQASIIRHPADQAGMSCSASPKSLIREGLRRMMCPAFRRNLPENVSERTDR